MSQTYWTVKEILHCKTCVHFSHYIETNYLTVQACAYLPRVHAYSLTHEKSMQQNYYVYFFRYKSARTYTQVCNLRIYAKYLHKICAHSQHAYSLKWSTQQNYYAYFWRYKSMHAYTYAYLLISIQAAYLCKNTHMLASQVVW